MTTLVKKLLAFLILAAAFAGLVVLLHQAGGWIMILAVASATTGMVWAISTVSDQ